jgi:phenylpyruvate tautomerase PptA (4-oxalocrotonate tautomerase family)
MSQVKVYGLKAHIDQHAAQLSEIIHSCIVEAFNFPADKRFHRFIGLSPEHFYYPADRGEQYTIIEISVFEGRTVEAKKRLIRLLYKRLASELQIPPHSVEITIFETPRHNWGIRGQPGDELALNYRVEV